MCPWQEQHMQMLIHYLTIPCWQWMPVSKVILENCLTSGPLSKKKQILVTHALHVLDKTDYIYIMDEGIIIEEGTYE
ncbi:hypothetical protein P691DRAFT_848468, partial [Macrolepiota fuliginosa MF-IS2]